MILCLIFLLLGIGETSLIYIFTSIHQNPWLYFLVPIFLIVFFYLNAAFCLFCWVIIDEFIDLKKEQERPNKIVLWFLRQILGFLMIGLVRCKTIIINKELIPFDKRCLFVINHISSFDHLCMVVKMPSNSLVSISKPENEKKFLSGKMQHAGGYITIDRENPLGAVKSILKGIKYIDEDIVSILVSPEGTRSKDGEIHEFHPACFKIALKTKCPIVLLSSCNTDKIKEGVTKRFRTKAYIKVDKVLYAKEYENMSGEELCSLSHDIIKKGMESLNEYRI